MRFLSVDLGVRNLAWCVMTRMPSKAEAWKAPPFHGQEVQVHHWRVIDVLQEAGMTEEVNLNEVDIAFCVPWFVAAVKKFWAEMTDGVTLACLEAQPTARIMTGGRAVSNIRTKVLSHILQAMLLEQGIAVKFVSPSKKLKDAVDLMVDASSYREHKKAAIALTDSCIATVSEDWTAHWRGIKGKRDDMADAFLQGVCCSLKEKIHKAKKRKTEAAPEYEIEAPDL